MIRNIKLKGRRVEYTLICSRARSTTLLQALPEDKIRVYAPAGVSLRWVDEYVASHIADIDAAHAKLRRITEKKKPGIPQSILLEGERIPLEIVRAANNSVSLTKPRAVVRTAHAETEDVLEQLKRAYVELSLARLRACLDKWSPTIGRSYGRVTVREQKTRWGSCSSKQNLNFNWKLIMAPPQALEYVVIHELCHLIYFNHSQQFWNEVGKRMPDYEIWKKWLKQHGKELEIG